MTITQNNYLDFGNLLINELFGSAGLFIIVGLVVITYFSVKERLPIGAIIGLNLLFIGATMSYVFQSIIWLITLMVLSLGVYAMVTKVIKR